MAEFFREDKVEELFKVLNDKAGEYIQANELTPYEVEMAFSMLNVKLKDLENRDRAKQIIEDEIDKRLKAEKNDSSMYG